MKRTIPSVLLDEPSMVQLMSDVQIMENAINYKKSTGQANDFLRDHAFDTIFSHYGIDDSIFKENLNYYNETPEVMVRILDSVTSVLLRSKD